MQTKTAVDILRPSFNFNCFRWIVYEVISRPFFGSYEVVSGGYFGLSTSTRSFLGLNQVPSFLFLVSYLRNV